MSRITVLVGSRQHPVSGRPARSKADAKAVSLALSLPGKPVNLLTAGDMDDAVARDYLALGATNITVVTGAGDACSMLAPRLQDVPWILTGTRGADEAGGNVLPFQLGAALKRPVITQVVAVEDQGTHWIVTQALPKGARRRLKVAAPAVIAISEAAPVTVRHALAAQMQGRIERAAGSDAPAASVTPVLQARAKRRAVLQASIAQSGHARMLGAIDTPASGGQVVRTGSPEYKAQVILDYLRAHALVNF